MYSDDLGLHIVQGPIGIGGYKCVFQAINEKGEEFALKVLNPEQADLNRLQREVRAMEVVDSPYVAKVFDWHLGSPQKYPFILEEFVDGQPLSEIIYEEEGYSLTLYSSDECGAFLAALLEGLSECANQEIVHRDIKPHNIMVRENGKPCLIDFGQARHLTLTSLTSTYGSVAMTWAWAPPEILDYSKKDIDETSDLFSIGIVGYEMLTGRHPFVEDLFHTRRDIGMDRMRRGEASPPHVVEPSVDENLSKFIMRLLRRNKVRRYRSVSQAYAQLCSLGIF